MQALALLALVAAQALYPADLPEPVLALLDSGRFVATPNSFRIIALSNIADACAAHASSAPATARACVVRAFRLAQTTKPRELDLAALDARHGLWLSHLALVLGAGDASGPCLDAKLHERLATTLARGSLADSLAHIPSYPGVRARWPADQSATLAALARYDRAHSAGLLTAPLARYIAVLDAHTGALGLPWSEVAGVSSSSRLPRGCALSFSVRYLSEADPKYAHALWTRYRERFLSAGLVATGFREWPPGVELPADADSGPIVAGIGAAASALGIAAARAMGEEQLASRIEATAELTKHIGGALSQALARADASTLAAAIRASGKTQPSGVH